MKFHQLTVGSRFSYQQKRYCKTSPLAATADDGSQRMIPRAARVVPEDGAADAPTAATASEPLRDALEAYHQRTLDLFDEVAAQLPEVQRQPLRQRLEDDYRNLLTTLPQAD